MATTQGRYRGLLRLQLRISLLTALQYRWDFLAQGAMQLLWMALSVLPLYIAYRARAVAQGSSLATTDIGGWGYYPATMVFAAFYLLKSVLDGAINPSLIGVVDHIRKGTLDFVLLKPADAQFLISTAKFELWYAIDGVAALLVMVAAGQKYSHSGAPAGAFTPSAILVAALLLGCGVLLLYSVWLLVVCAAFYVVRIDNLSYLFTSVFDFARWPRGVFRGALFVVFTYVLPLVIMTSFPVDALLGRLRPIEALWALLWTVVLLGLSRWVFRRSLASYTSASS